MKGFEKDKVLFKEKGSGQENSFVGYEKEIWEGFYIKKAQNKENETETLRVIKSSWDENWVMVMKSKKRGKCDP